MSYIIPVFVIGVLVYSAVRRVSLYDTFTKGASEGLKTVIGIFPYLVSIFVMLEVFRESGLSDMLVGWLKPLLDPIGIPPELGELIILRPLSGSGSIAILRDLIETHGADHYITRVASVIMGSSETVFYVTALYYSRVKRKRLGLIIPISVFASLVGVVLSALLCRLM